MCISFITISLCDSIGCPEAESAQIIIPAREVRRHNDIYVAVVSSSHMVAARGMYIAIVSTTVETSNPIAELNAGINLLGPIVERWAQKMCYACYDYQYMCSWMHVVILLLLTNSFFWLDAWCLRFDSVSDLRSPVADGTGDKCFISCSYDATSHFETAANDVLSIYERITGEQLDMSISADTTQEEEY
jgi:Rab GDP dissociation inhibitor